MAEVDAHATHRKAPFLLPGMLLPFVLLILCFVAWGTAANMTDTLVATFRQVFSMSTFAAALVQSAFYGAYFLLALPAAFINQRFGYKAGTLVGLGLAAVGGLLFFPASQALVFGFFLVAIFCLAAGLSILETSANPFVMAMGPEENATRRLNFTQAFNPVGTNLGVLIAALFILPNLVDLDEVGRAGLTAAELETVQTDELNAVMVPYVAFAGVLVLIWIGIALTKVDGLRVEKRHVSVHQTSRIKRLVANKHYSFGVTAQFFNVAGQTCIWTFTIIYVRDTVDVTAGQAGWWLQASLLVFLVSRFVMVALMGRFDSRVLMLTMTCLGVVLCVIAVVAPGLVGAVAVVAMSASLSLLFPTIYGIALEGLGPDTKFGAAGLVMAIVGGAILTPVQGLLVDTVGVAVSYIVPAVCFAVCASYAWYTLRTPRAIREKG